jgi:hypothetical protein
MYVRRTLIRGGASPTYGPDPEKCTKTCAPIGQRGLLKAPGNICLAASPYNGLISQDVWRLLVY